MAYILIRAINWFAQLLILALVIRALLSWFARDPYSTLGKVYMVLVRLTEPVVNPCRRLLQRFNVNTGMFDFSVLLAFFLIEIVARLLTYLIVLIF
ncbi:MAG: YggT family protein [Anaerovoracaceae bacterium]